MLWDVSMNPQGSVYQKLYTAKKHKWGQALVCEPNPNVESEAEPDVWTRTKAVHTDGNDEITDDTHANG